MTYHTQLIIETRQSGIVALLDEDIHAGTEIVSGESWTGQVYNPIFKIFDISGEPSEIRQTIVQHMTSGSDASTLNGYFGVDVNLLSADIQSGITEMGRAATTQSDILSGIFWLDGMDEDQFYIQESGFYYTNTGEEVTGEAP